MQHQDTLAAFADFFDQMGAKEIEGLRRAHDIFAALDPGELAGLSDALDIVQQDPRQYSEFRRIMREEGDVGEDVLPEQYSPKNMLLLNALTKSAMGQPTRQRMAAGGSPVSSPDMARQGLPTLLQQAQEPIYGTDTITAHITPGEAHLLQARGGAGVINQQTGNPQFFLRGIGRALSGVARGIGDALKKVAPIAIPLAATFVLGPAGLGLSPMMAGALGGGLSTLMTGGSASDAMRSAAIGGALGGLTGGFGSRAAAEGAAAGAGAQGVAGLPAAEGQRAAAVLAGDASTSAAAGQRAAAVLAGDASTSAAAGQRAAAVLAGDASTSTAAGQRAAAVLAGDSSTSLSARVPPLAEQAAAQGTPPQELSFMDRITGGARNVWDTYLSPTRGMPTNEQLFRRASELQQQAAGTGIQLSDDRAFQMAQQELTPGLISQYGPLTAAGMGVMALTGGFSDREDPGAQAAADERARFEQFTPPPGGFSIFSGGMPRYQQPAYETVGGLDMYRQPRMYAASGGIADVARVKMSSGGVPSTMLPGQSSDPLWEDIVGRNWERHVNRFGVGWDTRKTSDAERTAQLARMQREYRKRQAEQQAAAASPGFSSAAMPAASPPPPLPAARPLFPGSDAGVPQTPGYVPPAFDVSASPYVSAGAGFGGTAPNVGGAYDDAVRRAQQYFSSMQPDGELIDPADAVMVPPMPTQWQPQPQQQQGLAPLPPLLPEEERQVFAYGGSPHRMRRY